MSTPPRVGDRVAELLRAAGYEPCGGCGCDYLHELLNGWGPRRCWLQREWVAGKLIENARKCGHEVTESAAVALIGAAIGADWLFRAFGVNLKGGDQATPTGDQNGNGEHGEEG